jgi:hypothetical protein
MHRTVCPKLQQKWGLVCKWLSSGFFIMYVHHIVSVPNLYQNGLEREGDSIPSEWQFAVL